MRQEFASSIDEYMSIVHEGNAGISRKAPDNYETLCFRGQPNSEYELLPAIARDCKDIGSYSLLYEERNLIETAKYELPEVFTADLWPIELLALLQHHGIPTRLLDITDNPLVALFFACWSNEDEAPKDGEVFVFRRNEKHVANAPIYNAIADSYRYAAVPDTSLSSFFDQVLEEPYFREQKKAFERKKCTAKQYSEWIMDCCKRVIFTRAPAISRRQSIQQGSYILFHNKIYPFYDPENVFNLEDNHFFTPYIEHIDKQDESICARIIIPKEVKWEILDALKLQGISRKRLFLDNTDIVCEEIASDFKGKVGTHKKS